MIDRIAYIAMTGAKHTMGQLGVTTHNLANASTPGFKEKLAAFRAVPLNGEQADSRAFVVDSTPRASFEQGPLESTDNPYDLAIAGDGFFALRLGDGSEVYSRSGKFTQNENGVLTGPNGATVVGTAGDVVIPPNAIFEISDSGAVLVRENGEQLLNQIAQIKMVKPEVTTLVYGEDGFFRPSDGAVLAADETVRVKQGYIESSNVNPAKAMVEMINQSRMFDLNMRMIQTADQNSRQANVLLSLSNI